MRYSKKSYTDSLQTCRGKCDENRDCVTCQLHQIEGKVENCTMHCIDTEVHQEDELTGMSAYTHGTRQQRYLNFGLIVILYPR